MKHLPTVFDKLRLTRLAGQFERNREYEIALIKPLKLNSELNNQYTFIVNGLKLTLNPSGPTAFISSKRTRSLRFNFL